MRKLLVFLWFLITIFDIAFAAQNMLSGKTVMMIVFAISGVLAGVAMSLNIAMMRQGR